MKQELYLYREPAITQTMPRKKLLYDRKYPVTSLILLFFTFSFTGWLWEVVFHLFSDGEFVNRGVFMGPWLPIYGSGGLLILIFLKRFAKRPALLFILITVICSILEYATSWTLEMICGMRWWDYSTYFLNLEGRICLAGSILFGLGGCVFIYVLAPLMDSLYQKIPYVLRLILCILFSSIFICDGWHAASHPNTGKGITDYTISMTHIVKSNH